MTATTMSDRTTEVVARRARLKVLAPSLSDRESKFLAIHSSPQMFEFIETALELARADAECQMQKRVERIVAENRGVGVSFGDRDVVLASNILAGLKADADAFCTCVPYEVGSGAKIESCDFCKTH